MGRSAGNLERDGTFPTRAIGEFSVVPTGLDSSFAGLTQDLRPFDGLRAGSGLSYVAPPGLASDGPT
jgi:hypothetical protein